MKRIKDFFKENKGLSILLVLGLILLIIILFIIMQFVNTSHNGKYGTRLEGIEKVNISSKKISSVSKKIKDNDEVVDAFVRVQGKIVYVNITYKKDTSVENAKDISNSVLEEFSDEIKSYYDFSCFLVEEDDKDKETEEFVITGNKHHSFEGYTYIKE